MAVELQKSGYGARIGTIGPIVVSVIESSPQLPFTELLESVQAAQLAKYGRFSSVSIMTMSRLEPASAEFRQRTAEMSAKYAGKMTGTAIVILSTGAAAVIVRSFLAAWALLTHQDTPTKTFRQIAPAAEWLRTLEAQPPEVKQLTGLAAELEAFAFPQKPPQP